MDLIGRQTRDGADELFVRKFGMRESFIPVVSEVVDNHCQHLDHPVVYTFHPTAAVPVVGSGGNFSNPEKLVNFLREPEVELEAVVREDAAWSPPEGNIPVAYHVNRTLSGLGR